MMEFYEILYLDASQQIKITKIMAIGCSECTMNFQKSCVIKQFCKKKYINFEA